MDSKWFEAEIFSLSVPSRKLPPDDSEVVWLAGLIEADWVGVPSEYDSSVFIGSFLRSVVSFLVINIKVKQSWISFFDNLGTFKLP